MQTFDTVVKPLPSTYLHSPYVSVLQSYTHHGGGHLHAHGEIVKRENFKYFKISAGGARKRTFSQMCHKFAYKPWTVVGRTGAL